MEETPADLKKWPTNIFSQIAIALKGGELRETGLSNLAARLAVRVPLEPAAVESELTALTGQTGSFAFKRGLSGLRLGSRKASIQLVSRQTQTGSQRRTGSRKSSTRSRKYSAAVMRNSEDCHTYGEGAVGAVRVGDEENLSAEGAIPQADDVASL
uniref:Uncharacterized protein n=1 Tax=Prymnesium polylepis TaxID=72548 RepID=A0A7S4HTM0_9EUKA